MLIFHYCRMTFWEMMINSLKGRRVVIDRPVNLTTHKIYFHFIYKYRKYFATKCVMCSICFLFVWPQSVLLINKMDINREFLLDTKFRIQSHFRFSYHIWLLIRSNNLQFMKFLLEESSKSVLRALNSICLISDLCWDKSHRLLINKM